MKKIALLSLLLACAAFTAPAAVLPAEKLLPDDTLIVFTVPDASKLRDIYSKSPQIQLWNDPALKAFKEKFVNKFKAECLAPLEHDLGIKLDDYTSLPQGQFTLALTREGWDPTAESSNDPGMLLLMDAREKSAQLKSNLADLKKKWVDSGKSVKTEKIRDVDFSVISVSSNDLPKSLRGSANADDGSQSADKKADAKKSDKQTLYIGQADSLLILGNSSRSIEKVLAAMSGGSVKSLGELPAFTSSYNSMFRDSPMYGWVNVGAFISMLMKSEVGAGGGFLPDFNKLFPALGLTGLKTFSFSYNQNSDGAQVNLMLGVPEQARTGLFKILAGEPKESNPPAFVPADVVKFQRWRIDGQKSYEALRKIIRDVSPEAIGSVDMVLGMAESSAKEKNPDFDIKRDLFGNLGDDIISYNKAPKGNSLVDLASPPTLYLVGSPKPEKLADAWQTLLVLSGQQPTPKEREFLGRKIYSIQLPAGMVPTTGASTEPRALNYASSGGYLALSTDNSILEEYLRSGEGTGKALKDLSGLRDASQKVAIAGTSLLGYQNDSEANRALFNLLKKDNGSPDELTGGMTQLLSGMGGDFKLKDWFDVSLLPSYDKISKYFYFTVYAAGANPDGLFLKTFSPAPPELKK